MTSLDDTEKLISNYSRRLQKLKKQRALEGISTDPKILIEIEDIEAEIERLQAQRKIIEAESERQAGAMIPDNLHKEFQRGSSEAPLHYNLQVVHKFLLEAFADDVNLKRFLRQNRVPEFRKVLWKFGSGMGLEEMVDTVLQYCEQFLLLDQLIAEVELYNSAIYELYRPQLYQD